MTGAILFECRVWIGAGTAGPAHRCGATFAGFADYDAHYRERHDITRHKHAPEKKEPKQEKVEAQ